MPNGKNLTLIENQEFWCSFSFSSISIMPHFLISIILCPKILQNLYEIFKLFYISFKNWLHLCFAIFLPQTFLLECRISKKEIENENFWDKFDLSKKVLYDLKTNLQLSKPDDSITNSTWTMQTYNDKKAKKQTSLKMNLLRSPCDSTAFYRT